MILFLYMHCLIKQAPKNRDRDGLSDKTAPQSPCKLPAVTADGESIACVAVPCLVTVHYEGLMHYCKGSCTSSGKMGLTARMLMRRLSWPCFCSHLLSPRGPKKQEAGRGVQGRRGCVDTCLQHPTFCSVPPGVFRSWAGLAAFPM